MSSDLLSRSGREFFVVLLLLLNHSVKVLTAQYHGQPPPSPSDSGCPGLGVWVGRKRHDAPSPQETCVADGETLFSGTFTGRDPDRGSRDHVGRHERRHPPLPSRLLRALFLHSLGLYSYYEMFLSLHFTQSQLNSLFFSGKTICDNLLVI